jgi:hypothetical protein
MFRHARTLTILVLAALLIILGGIGTFTAEAASFKAVINEARSSDRWYAPLESYDTSPDAADVTIMPGLPY